jgi:hypothetical protein
VKKDDDIGTWELGPMHEGRDNGADRVYYCPCSVYLPARRNKSSSKRATRKFGPLSMSLNSYQVVQFSDVLFNFIY